jgi:peptidoglycan/xylan/chitin deacetylase (PgdA/CDA1 family)
MKPKLTAAIVGGGLWESVVTRLNDLEVASKIGTPVLLFHRVGVPSRNASHSWLYVSHETFRRLAGELTRSQFRVISLTELIKTRFSSSQKRAVITFDDGFAATLELAGIPLREHDLTAIQFLVANRLGQHNEWDRDKGSTMEPLMDRSQVKDWLSLGHEIGAHTLTHPHLTALTLDQAKREIVDSKKKLEDLFAVPMQHFAFPYGDHNKALLDIVREAGFLSACTTEPFVMSSEFSQWAIPRLYFLERRFAVSKLQWMKWGAAVLVSRVKGICRSFLSSNAS